MEVSIKEENKDKVKPKWACAAEAAWREKWVWILSQDHFVVDLPALTWTAFLSLWLRRDLLNQGEMGPIHQVGKRGEWASSVRSNWWHPLGLFGGHASSLSLLILYFKC